MKPQTLVMLLVAVGCGGGALVLSQNYMGKKGGADADKEVVYCAEQEITAGVQITEAMLKPMPFPKANIPEDAIRNKEDVVGKSARYNLAPMEMIRLCKLGAGEGMQVLIPKGMVATTVRIRSENGVAGFVKRDSHVDIACIPNNNQMKGGMIFTVLKDVKVLAVNSTLEKDKNSTEGQVLEMVTFLTTKQESLKLSLAEAQGALKLMLRAENDRDNSPDPSVSVAELEYGAGGSRSRDALTLDEPPEAIIAKKAPKEKQPSVVSMLGQFLANAQTKKVEKDKTTVVKVADEPKAPVAPKPPKKMLRVYYRDLAGNVLMEAVIPADSKLAESLKETGEIIEVPDESTGTAQTAKSTQPAEGKGPTKSSENQEPAKPAGETAKPTVAVNASK